MALTESMRSAASIIAEMESYRDKVRVSEITSFVSDNTGRFELQKGEWGEAYRLLGLAPSVDCVLFADAAGKRYMVPPHALSRTHEVSEALTLAEEVLRMRMLDFFEHVNALDSRSAELLRGLWQDGGVDSLRNLVRLHPEQAAELLRLLGR